jgi:hypothetical protein
MIVRRMRLVPVALAFALMSLVPLLAVAQEATPVAPQGVVVAGGLTNPRGFVWGPDGALYVALAGSGGSIPATETAPTTDILGPFFGGPTGAVARIDGGCPTAVVTGLPSTNDGIGEVLGAEDVAFLDGELYIGVDGGGPVHGNPDDPAGIYRANDDGSATLVADLSTWLRANPVAVAPPDYDPDSDGYRILADEAMGGLWVLEPNSGGVLMVTPDGTVSRIADLSEGHPVPSAIAPAPDGGIYIGTLTAVPFPDGGGKVIKVMPDGTVSDVWTGLTTVTGLAVAADGTLYASELATGNLSEPPFLTFGTGKVVRMTGASTSEEVVTGLMLPIGLAIGPDGGLYVSSPAIGANMGEGVIMRVGEVAGMATPGAMPMPEAPATCAPIPETLAPSAPATPVA